MPDTPGTVTLIGSGELTGAMGKVYRAILSRIVGEPRAVFLDTPAGFQLNADEISQRAVEYFRERLGIPLAVASFKERSALSPEQLDFTLHLIGRSRLIFAGPGSPTYAVHQWKDHAIWRACAARVSKGAHLMMASAAAIAMSRHTLPVYEIYKVGEAPRWVDGLDLFGPYGLSLALMPHWNNAEGGTHDTRFCFMGEPRLLALERQLPPEAVTLGIDEHTACILDLHEGTCSVMGAGGVTIRRSGVETVHPSGDTFSLDEIGATPVPAIPTPEPPTLPAASLSDSLRQARLQVETQPQDLASSLFALYRLAKVLEISDESESGEAVAAREHLFTVLAAIARAEKPSMDDVSPYIELLVQVRGTLRKSGQWAATDAIREGLAGLGVALEDTHSGTRWHRAH